MSEFLVSLQPQWRNFLLITWLMTHVASHFFSLTIEISKDRELFHIVLDDVNYVACSYINILALLARLQSGLISVLIFRDYLSVKFWPYWGLFLPIGDILCIIYVLLFDFFIKVVHFLPIGDFSSSCDCISTASVPFSQIFAQFFRLIGIYHIIHFVYFAYLSRDLVIIRACEVIESPIRYSR